MGSGTDDLVLRCEAEDGDDDLYDTVTLVRVNTASGDVGEPFRLPDAEYGIDWLGDPTVSPDGQTVVFFGEELE